MGCDTHEQTLEYVQLCQDRALAALEARICIQRGKQPDEDKAPPFGYAEPRPLVVSSLTPLHSSSQGGVFEGLLDNEHKVVLKVRTCLSCGPPCAAMATELMQRLYYDGPRLLFSQVLCTCVAPAHATSMYVDGMREALAVHA